MKFCTLHLSRSHGDHWGDTDSANRARCNWPQLLRCLCQRSFSLLVFFSGEANKITASLQLTLFQIPLGCRKTSTLSNQRCYFPSRYFVFLCFSFFALFLVRLSWQALLILIHDHTMRWKIFHG